MINGAVYLLDFCSQSDVLFIHCFCIHTHEQRFACVLSLFLNKLSPPTKNRSFFLAQRSSMQISTSFFVINFSLANVQTLASANSITNRPTDQIKIFIYLLFGWILSLCIVTFWHFVCACFVYCHWHYTEAAAVCISLRKYFAAIFPFLFTMTILKTNRRIVTLQMLRIKCFPWIIRHAIIPPKSFFIRALFFRLLLEKDS